MRNKIIALFAFMSFKKATRKLSNKQLNEAYVYYLKNKPLTVLQCYEFNIIKQVVKERSLCKQ